MKTAIIYYSFIGNNTMLAGHLAERLDADLFQIKETGKRNLWRIYMDLLFKRVPQIEVPDIDFQEYDHLILVSPMWKNHIAHPMKSFILQYKQKLQSFFFATLCGGRDHQKEAILKQFEKWGAPRPKAVFQLEIRDLDSHGNTYKEGMFKYLKAHPDDLKAYQNQINTIVYSTSFLPAR